MKVKLLGTGCPSCKKLEHNVEEALKELKIDTKIIKITHIDEIMAYGIMTPPALVVDEKLLFFGQVPAISEIKSLIMGEEIIDSEEIATGCKCSSCPGCGSDCHS